MFELTPDERMKALLRRNGRVVKKGELSPEMIRRYTTSVTFQSTLMKEFTNVLDYGKDVYCPECAIAGDSGAVTAWPLAPLLGKNPMADKGDMISFTCLHCGFVEHHKAPQEAPPVPPGDDHFIDAIRWQMAAQAGISPRMFGGPLNIPSELRNEYEQMEAMRRDMERMAGKVQSAPVAVGLSQSFKDFVKKHGGF